MMPEAFEKGGGEEKKKKKKKKTASLRTIPNVPELCGRKEKEGKKRREKTKKKKRKGKKGGGGESFPRLGNRNELTFQLRDEAEEKKKREKANAFRRLASWGHWAKRKKGKKNRS